jgi:hypothetical protein
VDAVEVFWPDGVWEMFPGTEGDRVLVLHKGTGKPGRLESGNKGR